MTPISKVKANSEFRIHLKPRQRATDPKDYRTVNVTVKDKPPTNTTWITGSGSYNTATNREIVLCVPPNVNVGDMFSFIIEVDDVGILDPRAEVIN
jgi:uncharacterized protein (DUF849 family)